MGCGNRGTFSSRCLTPGHGLVGRHRAGPNRESVRVR